MNWASAAESSRRHRKPLKKGVAAVLADSKLKYMGRQQGEGTFNWSRIM